MSKLIMLVGLPGSGKTTYAKNLIANDSSIVHYSSDAIREELYGDANIQGDANKVFRILHHRTKAALAEGKTVVYDATNVTRKNRKQLLNSIDKNVVKEAHVIWAPYEICIKRDSARTRSVGAAVISKFIHRWQSPFYDEGFDHVEVIFNLNDADEFNAEQYRQKMITDMKISHDNPHHTLDIYEHCVAAKNYIKINFDMPPFLSEAAFWHDIGKPLTKIFKVDAEGNKEDIAHYYQHDCVGGYLVYGCYADGPKYTLLSLISWLVSNHMQPFFDSNYYKGLEGTDGKELLDMLHTADLNAH